MVVVYGGSKLHTKESLLSKIALHAEFCRWLLFYWYSTLLECMAEMTIDAAEWLNCKLRSGGMHPPFSNPLLALFHPVFLCSPFPLLPPFSILFVFDLLFFSSLLWIQIGGHWIWSRTLASNTFWCISVVKIATAGNSFGCMFSCSCQHSLFTSPRSVITFICF